MDKFSECREMFLQAIQFSKCAELASDEIVECSTAIVVNYAFACEVYLKALLHFNDISFVKKHKLKDLFSLLRDKEKEAVKQEVFRKYGRWGNCYLENISIAFIEWRYPYEIVGKKKSCIQIETGFLIALNDSLRELCCQEFFGMTYIRFRGTYFERENGRD